MSFSSVQFSHSVVSNFLWPRGMQRSRPPCSSLTPGVYSNSCPLSWWCHPTISYCVVLISSWLQSFPASGSFQMNKFFESSDQSIGVSASAFVLPMNIQGWFPSVLTGIPVQGTLKTCVQQITQNHIITRKFKLKPPSVCMCSVMSNTLWPNGL